MTAVQKLVRKVPLKCENTGSEAPTKIFTLDSLSDLVSCARILAVIQIPSLKESGLRISERSPNEMGMFMQKANPHGQKRSDAYGHLGLLGKPPLFEGEEQTYHALLAEVSDTVTPRDIFEQIWAQEYVYRTTEVLRLRRIEVNLMRVTEYQGLQEALRPIVGRSQAERLAQGWAARKPDAIKEVKKVLRSAGLSTDSILASAFSLKLNDIDRIKSMLALAEARRDATLLEINRHRKTLGEELRRVAQHFEHDQRRALDTGPISADGSDVK